jgi:hypothetical protein
MQRRIEQNLMAITPKYLTAFARNAFHRYGNSLCIKGADVDLRRQATVPRRRTDQVCGLGL